MSIKVAVICPDRGGDRPLFLAQFHKQMARQTLKPEVIEVIDFAPTDDSVDITKRYRIGYEKIRGKGFDVVAFCENDEVYLPRYLEVMVKGWLDYGKPELFGINHTIYYHLGLDRSVVLEHPNRSSMMCTLMKPDLDVEWCADDYPYTDAWLWMNCKDRKTFRPGEMICLGIKHGISLCGGEYHSTNLKKYTDKGILFSKVVGEDLKYYEEIKALIPKF